MLEKRVDQADVPALALLLQIGQALRRLCPTDRIGQKTNGVLAFFIVHELMKLYDELHVFANAVARVAADFDDGGLVEGAECTGDDEQHAHHVKPDSAGQKCAQILRGLKRHDRILRKPDLFHLPVFNFATAADTHDAADRNAGRIADKGVDDLDERTLLQNGVRVDRDDDGISCDIDTRVERVRLAAVFLIQHDQLFVRGGAVDLYDLLRLQRFFIGLMERNQLISVDQQLQRVVFGTIIDHDDFVFRKIEREQISYGIDDGCGFVIRRNQQRDRHHVLGIEEATIVNIAKRANIPPKPDGGGDQLNEIDRANGDDVEQ